MFVLLLYVLLCDIPLFFDSQFGGALLPLRVRICSEIDVSQPGPPDPCCSNRSKATDTVSRRGGYVLHFAGPRRCYPSEPHLTTSSRLFVLISVDSVSFDAFPVQPSGGRRGDGRCRPCFLFSCCSVPTPLAAASLVGRCLSKRR
jgi:hypothetical protein